MKSVSGKDFCRLIEKRGWELKRITGSHHIYAMQGREERISVPMHGNKDLKMGLMRAQMKIAGITEQDL